MSDKTNHPKKEFLKADFADWHTEIYKKQKQ